MTLTFEGTLGINDMATHVPHHFDLPEGIGTLRVRFSHAPTHPGIGGIPHQLSISVYGPEGARGTRHNNADQAPVISARWASPGYLPGPIEPGPWRVEVDVHRLLPPGGVSYRIEVEWSDEDTPPPTAIPKAAGTPGGRGPGWYFGDLHGHTLHSDGAMTPAAYLEHARARGYDFVALTDHNTTSALAELKTRAGGAMTVIGGEELTTYHGHALVLGTDDWQEWRVQDGGSMSALARARRAEGQVFVIAHPMSLGHPHCTGCHWAHADMFPGPARHVEVWNGKWEADYPHNPLALKLYHSWLNAGHRLVATCGTDTHRPIPDGQPMPRIAIHAQDLTEAALLKGLEAGHCYLTSGPKLSFTAGKGTEMGDLIPAEPVTLSASWSSTEPDIQARLIVDGELVARQPGAPGQLTLPWTPAARSWALLELRGTDGQLHAMSNPIFAGGWPQQGGQP